MNTDALAAIKGTFSDFRIVRSRKIAQFVIEVPLEEADAGLQALGGVPMAANERWVAIAQLDPKAVQQSTDGQQATSQKVARPFGSLPYAQQTAIKCQDHSFQRFLQVSTSDGAAQRVRQECQVKSRAEIDYDDDAKQRWHGILADYDAYMRGFR